MITYDALRLHPPEEQQANIKTKKPDIPKIFQSFGSPAVLYLLIRPVAFRPSLTRRLALSNYEQKVSNNMMIVKKNLCSQ
jgi:hypothetical protein